LARSIPYLPGIVPKNPGLLARFTPPLPDGLASAWLSKHLAPGSWVLEPFGAAPSLAVEAAWAGYRVLVAANNPISRSLIELAADPPSEDNLRAALAELASTYKGDERIEPHIKSLYMTECSRCGQPVMVEYFLWERQAAAPFAKFYRCSNCGDSGEHPSSPADALRAAQFSSSGLHRARALERVAALNDPDRAHAEEALSVYLPRAVYALFTLINKLDGLSLPAGRRSCLQALLLNACDQASTLWAYPTERERPRLLATPHRFRENNIWLALEAGISMWNGEQAHVPLVTWPNLPPAEGGICLFEGRLKDLVASRVGEKIGMLPAVLAALPRPNQAFWTLSALWAGWLWGREAVGPFKSVLRRRRYDWAWHTAALASTLTSLDEILPAGTPIWGLVGETEPGFLASAMTAAAEAGFELDGLCLREEAGQAQITWKKALGPPDEATPPERARQCAAQGAIQYLQDRSEPVDFLLVQGAALEAMAQEHRLLVVPRMDEASRGGEASKEAPAEPGPSHHFNSLQGVLKDVFTYRGGFRRYEGSDQSLDVGFWWLKDPVKPGTPLADRVEMALVRYLQQHPGCTLAELDGVLCEAFPGLLTPDLELIQDCLESYGELQPAQGVTWQLRPQDTPSARRFDLDLMRRLIARLGEQFGFFPDTEQFAQAVKAGKPLSKAPFQWMDKSGAVQFEFYILASAALGDVISPGLREEASEPQRIIVLPGSRANLVAYKLQHNPHLKQEVESGWRMVKYRHLRRLAESPFLTVEIFKDQLNQDPIAYNPPQPSNRA
jgi:DNA-directed RNA polymerase subunit M/transcription elongation factor TFIIS